MAEINKLSVEKTLNKLRANDAKQSKEAMLNDKSNVLDEEIGRMRAQRLRLERHQGKHHQERHALAKLQIAWNVSYGVKPGLPPWGPHVRFRRGQTLVREASPLVKLRNSA